MSAFRDIDQGCAMQPDPAKARRQYEEDLALRQHRRQNLPRWLTIFVRWHKQLRQLVAEVGPDDPRVAVLEQTRDRAQYQAMGAGADSDLIQRLLNNPDELDDWLAYQNGHPS